MDEVKQYIYEPVAEFDKVFRAKHAKNVSDYFEDLIQKSGVDEEANKATVDVINEQKERIDEYNLKLSGKNGLKIFLIVLIVLFFLTALIFIVDLVKAKSIFPSIEPLYNYLIIVASLGLGALFIYLIVSKVNKAIKKIRDVLNEANDILQKNIKLAWAQASPLNNLFDWSMTAELMEKTIPLLDFDPYYRAERADYIYEKYGLPLTLDENQSCQFVQSGEIFGNPFLLMRTFNHYMGTKTYTGTLSITWTETITVNGKTQTVTRSQTLTASVTKPCPAYYNDDVIVYCNDAAPKLIFNRKPSKANSMSEREIERFVDKSEKNIAKKTEKAIHKGQSFQAMSNTEFELLFGAMDRNNEVEFRMLFTPLAQREMLNIIKDKKVGFGDDFTFNKYNQINYVRPAHLRTFDMDASPDNYTDYDIKMIRKKFNEYNNQYFRHFYFAMAPILAIPLYQQHKPREYIYKDVYPQKMANYDHEAHVNNLDQKTLQHPESRTPNILKTRVIGRDDNLDKVVVTAKGYRTVNHTEYVPVRGGDGRVHSVAVKWVEYIPVEQDSHAFIKIKDELDRPTFQQRIENSSAWESNLERLFGKQEKPIVRGKTITFVRENDFEHQENILLDNLLQPKD